MLPTRSLHRSSLDPSAKDLNPARRSWFPIGVDRIQMESPCSGFHGVGTSPCFRSLRDAEIRKGEAQSSRTAPISELEYFSVDSFGAGHPNPSIKSHSFPT